MQIKFRLLHKKVMLHQKNSIFVQLSNYALHLCAFYCSIYIFESASATDFIEKKINIFLGILEFLQWKRKEYCR